MALSYWISNIVNYDGEEMQIQLPSKADSEVLNLLTIDQLILLTQLVWHKSLTNSQLADILMDKEFAFSTDLNFLKRCGIIIQNAEILEINSFVYMQIVEKLERDRFI